MIIEVKNPTKKNIKRLLKVWKISPDLEGVSVAYLKYKNKRKLITQDDDAQDIIDRFKIQKIFRIKPKKNWLFEIIDRVKEWIFPHKESVCEKLNKEWVFLTDVSFTREHFKTNMCIVSSLATGTWNTGFWESETKVRDKAYNFIYRNLHKCSDIIIDEISPIYQFMYYIEDWIREYSKNSYYKMRVDLEDEPSIICSCRWSLSDGNTLEPSLHSLGYQDYFLHVLYSDDDFNLSYDYANNRFEIQCPSWEVKLSEIQSEFKQDLNPSIKNFSTKGYYFHSYLMAKKNNEILPY